jgi:hypothetical protein
MGQRHANQGFAGNASAADYTIVTGTSVTIAATNLFRRKADIAVTANGPIYLAYGAVATSTRDAIPIASQAVPYCEPYYTGAITAAVPSGASGGVRVREVF